MSAFRMNGQLQNSRNTLKILYGNQVGSSDAGDAMNEVVYVTPSGPASSPNFTVVQNQSDLSSPCLVNIIGTLAQGVGTDDATVSAIGNATLGWRNTGRYVEIGTDTANTSYIDLHSKENSLQDYDTRLISVGGNSGAAGQASFTIQSDSVNKTATIETYLPFNPGTPYNQRGFDVKKYFYSGTLAPNTTSQIFFSTTGGYVTLQMTSASGRNNVFGTAFCYAFENIISGATGIPTWYVTSPATSGYISISPSNGAGSSVTISGNPITQGGVQRNIQFILQGQLPVGASPPAFQILASSPNMLETSYYVIEYTQNIYAT